MSKVILLLPLLIFGMGLAHAEPLEDIQTSVLDYDGTYATILLDWNGDETTEKYEVGCVSCIPNIVQHTTNNGLTIDGVTAFPNTSSAMLYIISYNSNDEIISAKQVLVDIKE